MVKKIKKQKVVEEKPVIENTRQGLMLQAKERGIKNFRVLNKEELQEVLAGSASQERIAEVVDGAVARWKSGWGSRKRKT
ncbi:MAG: bacteriocin class II family protein [Candidatus Omnitrophica bacterium]|nr:bacteriocin class II family protein [Candidatus Omnitrophota bacterium]